MVFTCITRKEFETSGLAETIDPHYVIYQDEMLEHADPEELQQRLSHNHRLRKIVLKMHREPQ